MEQFSPLLQNTPLAGDLVESFKQGRSSSWYWRQVFWAVLMGLLNLFRKRWACLAYAVACGGLVCTAWFSIFPVTGRYTAQQFAVSCGGQVWSSPVQIMGPSSALPAVSVLYAKSFGIPWPWSLAYQIAFLTAFQAIVVTFALGAYLGFARMLKPQNLLRALMVIVVMLASSNVAATFLSVYSVARDGRWVLVSMPAIFALLLAMWQTNLGDGTSRTISA